MKFQLTMVEQISPNPEQPRRHFDPKKLKELAMSIDSQGLIEPLIIRPKGPNEYQLVAGERRWRAAQMIGLQSVPCILVDYDEQQTAVIALIENIQRDDLTLIEEAKGYHNLQRQFSFQQEDIARLVGKSRSHISNLLRLLSLDESIQRLVEVDKLSFGHARTLVGLPATQQRRFGNLALKRQWSVRQMELHIKQHKQVSQAKPQEDNPDIKRLEASISEQLGAPVACQLDEDHGGWLKIKFYDNDTLVGILDKMGIDWDETSLN